ncbi:MAG TPA: PAS domain-containing sensor histidine kinase [Labilithrix sp.]|nr:PAS domain-containing sensor histidine kinase [Labilithrix sp.]
MHCPLDFQHVFEASPNPYMLLDAQLRYVAANKAYLEVTGSRLDDLVGRPVLDAFPHDESHPNNASARLLDASLKKVLRTRRPDFLALIPYRVAREHGGPLEDRYWSATHTPIVGTDGEVELILQHTVDVTELERLRRIAESARAEAERANRLKDEFLATVSHELRTPLTSIVGWLQMFRGGQLAPDRRARAIDTIDRNARALAQLVEDILDVSRIMTGKMRLEVEPVRVLEATEAAVEAVRPAADAKGIRLQTTLDSKAVVMGDLGRLQQVVWNLVSNAVKFTPRGGRVHVVVERRESSVAISVLDTGRGIASEFLPHVFERFRQAEGGSTRHHGGLGLGLAIARHLAELHGGTISAESDGAGKGALFVVMLPIALTRPRVSSQVDTDAFDCPSEPAR